MKSAIEEHGPEIATARVLHCVSKKGISSEGLCALQKRGPAKGISYQTPAASVQHKYVEGQFGSSC